MKTINHRSILVVEPNEQIREEVVNFLLSAGYEKTDEAESFATALNKIVHSEYAVIVADAGEPLEAGLQFAADLARISSQTRIILMIDPEDQPSWDQIGRVEVHIMIKTDFTRNLLYLLDASTQP
jgi:DNA-binding response OmpR family regulator